MYVYNYVHSYLDLCLTYKYVSCWQKCIVVVFVNKSITVFLILDPEQRNTVYQKMLTGDQNLSAYYSACLAPLQIALVRDLPTKVKSLIRLIKYWNKDKVKVL